jgi:hypothetical protein
MTRPGTGGKEVTPALSRTINVNILFSVKHHHEITVNVNKIVFKHSANFIDSSN